MTESDVKRCDLDGLDGLPLLLSAKLAAKLLGISRSLFYSMYSSGAIAPLAVRLGRRTLWRRSELEQWVSSDPPCPSRDQWPKIRASLGKTGQAKDK